MTHEESLIVSAYTKYLMCPFEDTHKYLQEALWRLILTHVIANKLYYWENMAKEDK